MTDPGRGASAARVLLWIARLSATAVIVPLMLIAFSEGGDGPGGIREVLYLGLFPFGLSAGYLLGWRWPVAGGRISLACMAASLVVIGRVFGPGPYLGWGVLSVPGVLYIVAGRMLRESH